MAGQSLIARINQTFRMTMIMLVLPVVLSLLALMVYTVRYNEFFTRMERVAVLKPRVGTEIPEQVWSVVAGRASFDGCGVERSIDEVYGSLAMLMEGSTQEGRTMLTVTSRTMDTMNSYVQRIQENLYTRAPVAESELILDEIRDVAALAESMLGDYITVEINDLSNGNRVMAGLVMLVALLEMLFLTVTLALANRNTRRLARDIRAPIARLEHFARLLAEGNLQARVPATAVAELQSLTDSVNIMANRLESLIEQSRLEQENLKKAELSTLQAQINPHFLYNTLDAIIWVAEAGQSDSVIAITQSLSDFFRISLSSGADWIPLSQEIKHLSGYLAIQKIRYRDILNYDIDVPEELSDVFILKLLLQPLVENAIYHGIKYRRGGGTIHVKGRREGDMLHFSVSDTGRGMTAERLAEVRERMRSPTPTRSSDGSGFGLSNVDRRIRLYYGQEIGLEIQSSEEGTCVSFCVSARHMEETKANDEGIPG